MGICTWHNDMVLIHVAQFYILVLYGGEMIPTLISLYGEDVSYYFNRQKLEKKIN